MNPGLPQSADDMTDILDIEGVLPDPWAALIRAFLFAAVFLAFGLLAFLLVKKIIKSVSAGIKKPLSPEEKALQALKRLMQKNYVDQKQWRAFYFSLDEIFRHYLFEKFGLDVLDKTFEELKNDTACLPETFSDGATRQVWEFWERAQMAKFARQELTVEQAQADYAFVEGLVMGHE